ncbi:dinitrogenase iron-molybdenum cofactor biosynthesis protein [Hujiaoplasma nucleasis]|uniref:Dinitrogenase iron-molybdenum cofactor biosynthesis protein n=1 Tax=Hujiaoplasma nucleasis TaxID=2725268 RepID=A0A7L6N5C8_9MOLU|nr:NifB/NifX family molybdenum-iron cluster-binding protein [Hujiaoplasma nucleasis]QLY40692.1 dinitrogenase iron-molybdenum cofactor biosynthesis protein [Hujiaoplasma nucleasis]
MKILIPSKEKNDKSLVSDQLGRTTYFYLYDTDIHEGQFIENLYVKENHGAGVKTAEFILKNHVDYLITPRIGEKALDLLLDTQVKIYQSNGKIVKENIKDLLSGTLEELY